MNIPFSLINSLENIKGFNKDAFEKVHSSGGQITSIRINPSKSSERKIPLFEAAERVPWSEYGYYLKSRPSFTFDPFFHAGCYYVQEASSMFLEQALKQTTDLSKSLRILDLCAAPGGKSTHLQSLISQDSLLLSNDVIRSRANVLKDNIIKWGGGNAVVTNNDPGEFARLENFFDVIVVDAPCSGSGLFRKDAEAIHEWSENNVRLCSQRQQRIVADVWPALKKGGILIYSTCSYSKEEDEEIMDWITDQLRAATCRLQIAGGWGIVETNSSEGNYGYRFWPDKVKGEGFFLSCFQKEDGAFQSGTAIKKKPVQLNKNELMLLEDWTITNGKQFVKHLNTVYAWPAHLAADFSYILENVRVLYSGTIIGELIRDKLVPSHALALSICVKKSVKRIELNHDQAINFLQRRELDIKREEKGWKIVTYNDFPLGWINVLANRINNYYPKELRIIKDN